MNGQDFTAAFSVDQSPEEAFDAINNVRGCGQKKLKAVPTDSVMSLSLQRRPLLQNVLDNRLGDGSAKSGPKKNR